MLTIGQLISNEQQNSSQNEAKNDNDVKNDNIVFPSRVITVRSFDATDDRESPPINTNLHTRAQQEFPPANTDTFASDSKSEGEVLRSELLDDLVSVSDDDSVLQEVKKTKVVLNLPTITADNETSAFTDGGSISEYDISTLSGGEL